MSHQNSNLNLISTSKHIACITRISIFLQTIALFSFVSPHITPHQLTTKLSGVSAPQQNK
jgi:hypothetical protein